MLAPEIEIQNVDKENLTIHYEKCEHTPDCVTIRSQAKEVGLYLSPRGAQIGLIIFEAIPRMEALSLTVEPYPLSPSPGPSAVTFGPGLPR